MSRNAENDPLDPVWRALSNSTRRGILDVLAEGPLDTGALSDRVPSLSRFTVMQHLRVLEDAELVVRRRVGRRNVNYLNPVPIQQIYRRWIGRYQQPWTEALVALKDQLETDDTHDDDQNAG